MTIKRTLAALALAACTAAAPLRSSAAVFISVRIAPPALPVYEQPFCPGDDYIWTPGYWQWDPQVSDYYWVPGTWVLAPQTGYLWTPGYWGYENSGYLWHAGYWGPHIGFYGGVNYGFGYFGTGFAGGYWNGPHFFYNTAISRVNVTVIHNTYVHNVTVVNNTHVAFNGPGGVTARPTPGEQAAFRENHVAPTGVQLQHASFAQQNRSQFASTNHGMPPAAAMARPAQSPTAFRANVAPARAAGGPVNTNQGGNGGFRNNTSQAPAQRGFAGGGQVNSQVNGSGGFQPRAQGSAAQAVTPQQQPAYNRPAGNGQQYNRPAPQTQQYNRPVPESRPAPEARPAPAERPAPQARPAPRAEEHERR